MSKIIYLISSDLPFEHQLKTLKKILPYGIDCFQYRAKNLTEDRMRSEIYQYKLLCDLYGTHLYVNDHVHLAKELNVSGVHIGDNDLSVPFARTLLGEHMFIGRTSKTVFQAVKAANEGADYLGVGALYPSSTKPNARPMTVETLRAIKSAVKIPLIGIGGLTPSRITDTLYHLLDGFAFSNAIWSSINPVETLQSFKKK